MTSNANVGFMRLYEEDDQLGRVMRPTAACKMWWFFFFFFLSVFVSGAILKQSRVKSVLSGGCDGGEWCGEMLSAGAHVMDSSTRGEW